MGSSPAIKESEKATQRVERQPPNISHSIEYFDDMKEQKFVLVTNWLVVKDPLTVKSFINLLYSYQNSV